MHLKNKTGICFIFMIFSCDQLMKNGEQDNSPPEVLISNPENQSTLTFPTTIKIEFAENYSIIYVEFYINGEFTHSDSLLPFEYDWYVCDFDNQSYTLLVKAIDESGREITSDLYSLTINAQIDCNDQCGGNAFEDNCGSCIVDSLYDYSCIQDCRGVWGGSSVVDECGVCDGDGLQIEILPECSQEYQCHYEYIVVPVYECAPGSCYSGTCYSHEDCRYHGIATCNNNSSCIIEEGQTIEVCEWETVCVDIINYFCP